MTLLDHAIVRLLPTVPKPVVERLSRRYIAGERLEDALRVVARENSEGKTATVDVLGEDVESPEEAAEIAAEYARALREIERRGLDANISAKPTSLGLRLGYGVSRGHVAGLAREAAARGNFLRVEMEDSSTTDDTIRLYRELREEGHENVGVVLQAYLRRTADDARALADLRPNVRLVKGIYVEPESIAFKDAAAIRAGFVDVLEELLAAGAYAAIATHDDRLIEESLRLVARHGLGRERYEFQLLLGVRADLGDRLVRDGHRVRAYIPYGARWYPYSLRRLQENPRLAGYVAADVLSRLVPGRGGRGS